MHFCSKFGNCNFNWWWAMACTSSKWGKFWLWCSIWTWRSWSIIPQNNRDLNQGLLHLWSKFGDPSLKGWWVIAQTNSWITDTQTHIHTHAGNDNTRRPKLASGKKYTTLFTTILNGSIDCTYHHLNYSSFRLKRDEYFITFVIHKTLKRWVFYYICDTQITIKTQLNDKSYGHLNELLTQNFFRHADPQ